MQIVRIKIENYRCIKKLTFFPSKHNILIGHVNSGKSTLLNALSLVADPDISRRYRPVEELDFFEGKILDSKGRPIAIKIEVTFSYCLPNEKNHFLELWEPWEIEKCNLIEDADDILVLDDKKNKFAFRITFEAKYDEREKEIVPDWYYPKFSFIGDSEEYRKCYQPDREKIGFFMIPAERDIRKALSFTRYSALDKALRTEKVNLDDEISKIGDSIQGVGEILFDNKEFEALIEEVQNRTEDMLDLNPDIKRKLTFEMSGLGQYDIMNVLRAFVAPKGAPRSYPIANQGMGAKQIITLATLRMLASRKKSSIIAIEEPENSLHPQMQRSLVTDLFKTDCQTFVTTHSVHVAEVSDKEHLYVFLDSDNGEKQAINVKPSKNKTWEEPTIKAIEKIQSHYPSEVLDSYFCKNVLLVEGPGDREAIPSLIRRFGSNENAQNLDDLGVVVIPCIGKESIPRVAPYFRSFGKKIYALADSEKGSSSGDVEIVKACDCAFFWPEKTAIERVLLDEVTEPTIDGFIVAMTDFGHEYFVRSNSASKGFDGKKEDVKSFLKKRLAHRKFAEFLQIDQPPKLVQLFAKELTLVLTKQKAATKVIIDATNNS